MKSASESPRAGSRLSQVGPEGTNRTSSEDKPTLAMRSRGCPVRRKGGDGGPRRATASTVLPGGRLWRRRGRRWALENRLSSFQECYGSGPGEKTAQAGRRGPGQAVMDDQVIRRGGRGRRTSHKSQPVNPRQADPRRALVVRLEVIGSTGSARDVDVAQDRRSGRAAETGWEVFRVQWTVENRSDRGSGRHF